MSTSCLDGGKGDANHDVTFRSSTPIQRIITTEKGVAIDFDSVSKDAKTQSKELYTWGQGEAEDVKDGGWYLLSIYLDLNCIDGLLTPVTDRLAYLNFVQGSLASSLALKLDTARAQLKNLRDTETSITPRRNIRAGLSAQISRVEHEQQKGNEKRLEELRVTLKKHEAEDEDQEKQIEILKRKAIKESEQQKWDAIREVGSSYHTCKSQSLTKTFFSMERSLFFYHKQLRPLPLLCPLYLLARVNIRVLKPQPPLEPHSSAPSTITRQDTSTYPRQPPCQT